MIQLKKRKALYWVALALPFVVSLSKADSPTREEDEIKIRSILQKATNAYLRRDAIGAMLPYWKSDKLYVFDLMPPVFHTGYMDSLQSTRKFIDGSVGPVHVDYTALKIEVDNEHAYSHAIVHISAKMKNGGLTDISDRTTDVWQRQHGSWFIIHEHNSVVLLAEQANELLNATAPKN